MNNLPERNQHNKDQPAQRKKAQKVLPQTADMNSGELNFTPE
jgi:hypothetical protein